MLICIGTALIAAGIVILAAGIRQKNINGIPGSQGMLNESEIVSLEYYHGGSAVGNLYSIYLHGNSFTVKECPGNGYKTTEKKYKADKAFYQSLENIISEYDMKSWTDLPRSELIMIDGSETSLSVDFKDGSRIRAGSSQELPENGWEGIRKITELFNSITDN